MVAYVCLLLFYVLEYVRPAAFVPAMEPLHLNLMVPLIAVVAALFYPRGPAAGGPVERSLVIMAVMILLLIVSRFTAFVGAATEPLLEGVVGYVAVAWVIMRVVDTDRRLRGVFGMLAAVHIAIMVLSPEMLLDPSARTHGLTSGSFLGDGNDFALSLVIAIPLCLYLLFGSRGGLKRVVLVLTIAFLLLGVVASQSRGATIALALVGLHYWFNSGRSVAMAAVAGTALIVILTLAPDTYFARMSTIGNPTDGSAQGRITSWKKAWSEALKNPILGIGAGNTPHMHYQNPHSIYFMALGELGFPGFLTLIALIAWNLAANRRLLRTCRGPDQRAQRQLLAATSASMIAFATAGAFLSATYYPHAYLLAGLLTAARRVVFELNLAAVPVAPARVETGITYHWALASGPRRTS
jgi:putative inorganic carbon (HCO3(-)) transporter